MKTNLRINQAARAAKWLFWTLFTTGAFIGAIMMIGMAAGFIQGLMAQFLP